MYCGLERDGGIFNPQLYLPACITNIFVRRLTSKLNIFSESQKTPPWQDPKFPTECFFLTLHCHHISIVPATRRYQQRLRAIRDVSRMVEDLENTEPIWSKLPNAARSKELLKKWKSQVQVNKYRTCRVRLD